MAIIKRLTKGSALTHSELDGNFTELENQLADKEAKFTPIAENAYGTHPAFTTQNSLNVWLLQNAGEPTAQPTYDALSSAVVSNVTETGFDYTVS